MVTRNNHILRPEKVHTITRDHLVTNIEIGLDIVESYLNPNSDTDALSLVLELQETTQTLAEKIRDYSGNMTDPIHIVCKKLTKEQLHASGDLLGTIVAYKLAKATYELASLAATGQEWEVFLPESYLEGEERFDIRFRSQSLLATQIVEDLRDSSLISPLEYQQYMSGRMTLSGWFIKTYSKKLHIAKTEMYDLITFLFTNRVMSAELAVDIVKEFFYGFAEALDVRGIDRFEENGDLIRIDHELELLSILLNKHAEEIYAHETEIIRPTFHGARDLPVVFLLKQIHMLTFLQIKAVQANAINCRGVAFQLSNKDGGGFDKEHVREQIARHIKSPRSVTTFLEQLRRIWNEIYQSEDWGGTRRHHLLARGRPTEIRYIVGSAGKRDGIASAYENPVELTPSGHPAENLY